MIQCLGQEKKNILHHLFGDKIIQNRKQNFVGSLTIIPTKAKSIIGYTDFKPQVQ